MSPRPSLAERVHAVEIEDAQETLAEWDAARDEDRRASALMLVGALRAVNSLQSELNSQVIRKMQLIRDERLFTAFADRNGQPFKRFDAFLNESPYSPMGYDKFNHHEKLMLSEGDELFDALNAVNIPVSKRRLLGKGTVLIEGEEVVIRADDDADDKGEERIPLTDRKHVLRTLSRIADRAAEQSRTIARGRAENDRLKRKLVEAEKSDTANPKHPLRLAVTQLVGACQQLCDELAATPSALRLVEYETISPIVTKCWQKISDAALPDEERPERPDLDLTDDDIDALAAEM